MTLPITKNALGAKPRAFFTHGALFRADEWISPMVYLDESVVSIIGRSLTIETAAVASAITVLGLSLYEAGETMRHNKIPR